VGRGAYYSRPFSWAARIFDLLAPVGNSLTNERLRGLIAAGKSWTFNSAALRRMLAAWSSWAEGET